MRKCRSRIRHKYAPMKQLYEMRYHLRIIGSIVVCPQPATSQPRASHRRKLLPSAKCLQEHGNAAFSFTPMNNQSIFIIIAALEIAGVRATVYISELLILWKCNPKLQCGTLRPRLQCIKLQSGTLKSAPLFQCNLNDPVTDRDRYLFTLNASGPKSLP